MWAMLQNSLQFDEFFDENFPISNFVTLRFSLKKVSIQHLLEHPVLS